MCPLLRSQTLLYISKALCSSFIEQYLKLSKIKSMSHDIIHHFCDVSFFALWLAQKSYNYTLVYGLNLFYDLGGNGCVCVCMGKVTMVIFVTQCVICRQHNFAKCFCLQIEVFVNQGTMKLNVWMFCFFNNELCEVRTIFLVLCLVTKKLPS